MKRCYIITFDLKNSGLNQEKLVASIKTAPWARLSGNTFIITSTKTTSQIRDVLLGYLYQGDKIYVGLLGNSGAWYGLADDVSNWIRNNQR